ALPAPSRATAGDHGGWPEPRSQGPHLPEPGRPEDRHRQRSEAHVNTPYPGRTGNGLIGASAVTSLDAPDRPGKVTWAETAIAALAFGALGLWRVSDAFVRPGYSLSESWGAGIGGLGWMFEH